MAQDTLIDPVKCFAYERFGPDMLNWQHCSTVRDYLIVGLQAAIPLYAGSIIFLVILGVLGYLQWGRFVCYTKLQFPLLFSKTYRTLEVHSTVALLYIPRSLCPRIPHTHTALPPPISLKGHQSLAFNDDASPNAPISGPNPRA